MGYRCENLQPISPCSDRYPLNAARCDRPESGSESCSLVRQLEAVSMAKSKMKRKKAPKSISKLPDLEQSKSAVLNSLTSPSSQRTYEHAIREFIDWYCSEPRLAFNKTVVTRYHEYLLNSDITRQPPSTAVGGCSEVGLRGCRLRSAQCRLGRRDSSR